MKKLPPFQHDVIAEEDIDFFDRKSAIGWDYLTQGLMNKNNIIHTRIDKIMVEKEKRDRQMAQLMNK